MRTAEGRTDSKAGSAKLRRLIVAMSNKRKGRKGKQQKRTASTSPSGSASLHTSEDHRNESPIHHEEVQGLSSMSTKNKGRGPAKGDKGYGKDVCIFDGRFVENHVVRSIWPIFRSELKGPYTTWSQYPADDLDELFERWRTLKHFKFNNTEEEVKAVFTKYINERYPDWMSEIQNSVFDVHKSVAARYANNPSYLPPAIWTKMVDQWLHGDFKIISERNAKNRQESTLVHTTGSVPMAKYIKDEIDKNGVRPGPIEMFRRFHVSKPKDGQPEHWPSKRAEALYEKMELKKNTGEALDAAFGIDDEGEAIDEWTIYKEVVGSPKRGKIIGLGSAMEPPEDVCASSSSQVCNKRVCLEQAHEIPVLTDQVATLQENFSNLQQLVQTLISNGPNGSQSVRESPTTGHANGESSAH